MARTAIQAFNATPGAWDALGAFEDLGGNTWTLTGGWRHWYQFATQADRAAMAALSASDRAALVAVLGP
jgi:hypothetical protein